MRRRVLLLLVLLAVLICLLFSYTRLYYEANPKVNPLSWASAAIRLELNNSGIVAIESNPGDYLIKTNTGIAPFIALMENQGWRYQDQMGAGIVFVKHGQTLTAVSRHYSRYYMIITVPESQADVDSLQTITLTATGDILMHNTVIASGKQGNIYNYDHLFAPIKSLLEEGDYSSVNLESAIAGPDTGYTGYPIFNSPDSIANALKNCGFDLAVTASNHTLDRGYQGALRTLDVLRQAGLDTTGTYKTLDEKRNFLIKDIRGIKVGYLAYSYDTNGVPLPKDKPYFYNLLDRGKILADISALRPNVDILVLVLHWGVEYSPYPTEQQRKLATEFFQKGADVILGSHPHVIQPMETMQINGKNKFVIYSMGNSMGNQNGVERNTGVVIKLQFTKDPNRGETSLTEVNYTPTYIHPYYVNGKQLFRVVPIEATIKAIQAGTDPHLGAQNIPLLQEILTKTNKQLTQPLH